MEIIASLEDQDHAMVKKYKEPTVSASVSIELYVLPIWN